jgi:hypothetical protein
MARKFQELRDKMSPASLVRSQEARETALRSLYKAEARREQLVLLITRAMVKRHGQEMMNAELCTNPDLACGSQLWLRSEYDALTAVVALEEAGLLNVSS